MLKYAACWAFPSQQNRPLSTSLIPSLAVSADPTNLTYLHDIVLPEAPGFWPPAQGFWILVALVLMLILTAAWQILRSRQRNAYRRAGLILLASAKTVYEVNVILKRVALAAFPRATVAHLHGEPWRHFLESTCRSQTFAALQQGADDRPPDQALLTAARTWIRRHTRTAP